MNDERLPLGRCVAPEEDGGICALPGETLDRERKLPLCVAHASEPPGEMPLPSRKQQALLCAMFVYAEEGSLERAAEAIVLSGDGWTLAGARAEVMS